MSIFDRFRKKSNTGMQVSTQQVDKNLRPAGTLATPAAGLKNRAGISSPLPNIYNSSLPLKSISKPTPQFEVDFGRDNKTSVSKNRADNDIVAATPANIISPSQINPFNAPQPLIEMISSEFAKHWCAMPVDRYGDEITILHGDPTTPSKIEKLLREQHKNFKFVFKLWDKVVLEAIIQERYQEHEEAREAHASSALKSQLQREFRSEKQDREEIVLSFVEALRVGEDEREIEHLLTYALTEAIRRDAADMGFYLVEDLETGKKVFLAKVKQGGRRRIILEAEMVSARHDSLSRVIKILCGHTIKSATDKRNPQSGVFRAKVNFGSRVEYVECRVNFIPTDPAAAEDGNGEAIDIRIQRKRANPFKLENLGLTEPQIKIVKNALKTNPRGLLLNSGGTGSGKNVTQQCMIDLRLEYFPGLHIVLIEDPIEFINKKTVQISVGVQEENGALVPAIAQYLAPVLRAAPNDVGISETRHPSVARMVVEAALTDHLVYTTVHADSALGTLVRMRSMGIENYLLARTLKLLINQTLLPRICKDCEPVLEDRVNDDDIPYFDLYIARFGNKYEKKFMRGSGKDARGRECLRCEGTGRDGSIAIYEILPIDYKIRKMIESGTDADEIQLYAIKNQSFCTKWMSALEWALRGVVDLAIVLEKIGPIIPELEGIYVDLSDLDSIN